MAHAHHILVVEDDDDVRASLVRALDAAGFATTAVGDGAAALTRLLGGFRPCVILLDLMMPGMNGWQFMEAQRAHPGLATTPVVVVSAYASAEGVRAVGATDYLRKPVETDALLGTVARYCPHETPCTDA